MGKLRKIGSLVLAIMMIAVVGLAGAETVGNNYSGDSKTLVNKNAIPLTKTIVFFNADGEEVYEPAISFSYAVAPDASVPAYNADPRNPDTTVKDKDNNVGRVYPGPTGGVTDTTIAFAPSETAHEALAKGSEVTKSGNLTFVPGADWKRPGIYRYVITESVVGDGTDDAAKIAAAGLTERGADYSTTRYLDVYVKYADPDATVKTYEMYGAVIYKDVNTTDTDDSSAQSITSNTTGKTTGYEPEPGNDGSGSTPDYTNDGSVDRYTTYNFEVKKTVDGTLGDRNNDFPFYVSITNSIVNAKFTYTDDAGTSVADTVKTGATITRGSDEAASTLALKHNESIKFIGVPSSQSANLSIDVKEWNNTFDAYTATVDVENGTKPAVSGEVSMERNAAATIATFDIKANDVAAQLMTVTNTLTEISPTGYVSRFAPYALILAAGIILLIVAKKRKHVEEE